MRWLIAASPGQTEALAGIAALADRRHQPSLARYQRTVSSSAPSKVLVGVQPSSASALAGSMAVAPVVARTVGDELDQALVRGLLRGTRSKIAHSVLTTSRLLRTARPPSR